MFKCEMNEIVSIEVIFLLEQFTNIIDFIQFCIHIKEK